MNCLYLVLLLLCCGNSGNGGCGCMFGQNRAQQGCGFNQGCGRGGDRGRNDDCGCNDREPERNEGCGCRNDDRPEPRLEPRPFIPYPGPSCGCDEPNGRSGCNCAD